LLTCRSGLFEFTSHSQSILPIGRHKKLPLPNIRHECHSEFLSEMRGWLSNCCRTGNVLATFELPQQHFELGDKLRHVLLISVSESYVASSQVERCHFSHEERQEKLGKLENQVIEA